MKSLKDISWNVTEPEYRQDPALSYSTLAKYEREGFDKLDSLFDKVDTPSLTFGSAVDALITGGQQEFDDNFMVADFPEIKDSVKGIVHHLFNTYGSTYSSIEDIPNSDIIPLTEALEFQRNWKPETRAKVIREQGYEYYKLLFLAGNKKILDNATAQQVFDAVRTLKESEATAWYFADDNPFDNIERCYQLKFKSTFQNVDYRCMMDLAIVLHDEKRIIPCDLKTSGHKEWDFPKSFIQWMYPIQARLYWRILRDNMDKDDYFKDFILDDYRFIVVNKNSLTPLVWQFSDTNTKGTLTYGKNKQIELRDPCDIGRELMFYLQVRPSVPIGISTKGPNFIVEHLNQN